MESIKKATEIWKAFGKEVMPIQPQINEVDVRNVMGNLFCPGPWYSFIFEINEGYFSFVHPNAHEFYGKDSKQVQLVDLFDHIHPDDHEFLLRCEAIVADFLTERVDADSIFKYKFTYSYRFRDITGQYRHFLHQCIAFARGPKGNMTASFGVHSYIDHLVPQSNNKLSIIGMDGYPSYLGIDVLNSSNPLQLLNNPFTQRETEIIRLISQGMSSGEIAKELFISEATARTHRQNILEKAACKNTAELVAKCFRMGIL